MLRTDPTLLDRLATEGKYHKIDALTFSPHEAMEHLWRRLQESEISEVAAKQGRPRKGRRTTR